MSEDYETKRTDLQTPSKDAGGERPAVEDPLVELARIVHKNKQSGANVSSGRVGTTDYFAGLDDFSDEQQDSSSSSPPRVEPTFSSLQPEADNQNIGAEAGHDPESTTLDAPTEQSMTSPAVEPIPTPDFANLNANVSPLWPKVSDLQANVDSEPRFEPNLGEASEQFQYTPTETAISADDITEEQTGLTASVALDLEQNLTAELEDELIGALRQSVDEEPQVQAQPAPPPVEISETVPIDVTIENPLENMVAQETKPEAVVAPNVPGNRFGEYEAPYAVSSGIGQAPVVKTGERGNPQPADTEPPIDVNREIQAEVDAAAAAAGGTVRPAIDENDLFAALNPVETPIGGQDKLEPDAENPDHEKRSGIDALFADLEFPDPAERKPVQGEGQAQAPDPEPQTSAAEIDEMTWPAAAEAVPKTEEDETPPPPEGYDLDAVARAMQESDPSLTGAGVLPPHPSAEEAAVPQAKEKSRRGLFVAAGVLGVAVLGGAGFFLIDGDAVQVPSGPPPIISGLQEPLKIYPEESQTPQNDQRAKLDYDRVNGPDAAVPDSLNLAVSPQPAELPPAPAGSNGSAELVPGAPKRVRTLVVRPDGTIISEGDQATSNTLNPTVPTPSAPTETPRVVATTPVIPGSIADQPITSAPVPAGVTPVETQIESPVATEQPVAPAAPAVVATPTQPAPEETAPAETVVNEPAAPVPSVLPRKKPAAPVQVASAPVAQTAPAPAVQNDGPLNLSQTASAPAPAPAATNAGAVSAGSIPSGTYIVQVTSQRSSTAASDAYSGLQRRYPAILGSRNAVIVPADLGDRGVFYRARIPTGSRDEANSLCESLQGAGGDCFVRRQP